VKLRKHRGSLVDSMATVIEIEPTMKALLKAMREDLSPGWSFNVDDVTVEPYGWDERIGWDTHIVNIAGFGPYGFTDGPLREPTGIEKHTCEFVLASDLLEDIDPDASTLAQEAWDTWVTWGDADRTLMHASVLADVMDASKQADGSAGWNSILVTLRALGETYVDLEN
jgi:hypothetical protein